MKKDFDKWNIEKKCMDAIVSADGIYPKVGEVWICKIGLNVGREQDGAKNHFSRPVLVVHKFNNQMFWVVPLSTKQKDLDFYYNFTDPEGNKASVILAQMRLVSIKRFARDMYIIDSMILSKILDNLIGFLKKSKPRTGRGFSKPL